MNTNPLSPLIIISLAATTEHGFEADVDDYGEHVAGVDDERFSPGMPGGGVAATTERGFEADRGDVGELCGVDVERCSPLLPGGGAAATTKRGFEAGGDEGAKPG